MRPTLALAVIVALASPLPAQDGTSKLMSDMVAAKSPSLAFFTCTVSNELGSQRLGGQVVCIDASGIFVTTAIDVWVKTENVKEAKLILPGRDGKSVAAKFLWIDPETNTTVIKATEGGPFTPVKFDVSAKLEVGDQVVGVGLMLGDPLHTPVVAPARVSAKLLVPVPMIFVADGNLTPAGSPVFNSSGAAIGMVFPQPPLAYDLVVQGSAQDVLLRGRAESNFFYPSSVFSHVLEYAIKNPDKPRRLPWIGVLDLFEVSKEEPRTAKLEVKEPAVMIDRIVKGSNGDKAGLKGEDVVIAVNGKPLEKFPEAELTRRSFINELNRIPPDQKVTLTVLRGPKKDEKKDVTVPLEPAPQQANEAASWVAPALGLAVRERIMLDQYQIKDLPDKPGLLAAYVSPRGPADMATLKPNDLITTANNEQVTTVAAFKAIAQKAIDSGSNLTLVVLRGQQQPQTIVIRPAPIPKEPQP